MSDLGPPEPGDRDSYTAVTGAALQLAETATDGFVKGTCRTQAGPTWRAARQRWTEETQGDADPEDPTPLVTYLVEQPVAARSTSQRYAAADPHQQLRRYWRNA